MPESAEGGHHGIKGNFQKAVLSQMALECAGLHHSGGTAAHFCHSGDPPDHVVEQKTAAGWAGRGLLPPADPGTAHRADLGGPLPGRGRTGHLVLPDGPEHALRGGAVKRRDELWLLPDPRGGSSCYPGGPVPGLPEPAGRPGTGEERPGPVHS